MPTRFNSLNMQNILNSHQNSESGKYQSVAGDALDPQLVLLRSWQVKRLKVTNALDNILLYTLVDD